MAARQERMLAKTHILRPVVDLIMPPRCPLCGAMVEDDLQLCAPCWSGLHFITEPACTSCGRPFAGHRDEGLVCGPCMAEPPLHDGIGAAVVYDDRSRQLPLKLKYGGKIGLARLMAGLMARHVPVDQPDMVLIPVPLHRWRIWRRGFNQSVLIADALAEFRGIAHIRDALCRTRATPPMKGLNPRQRRESVRGVFRINPHHADTVRDRDVLLVDDVYTSGATAEACVRVLKKAGARTVRIICWARVLREGEEGGE